MHRIQTRLAAQEGFTLIELLVVILIIGVLAAIAIPSFLNQRGKAEDAAAKSSVREAATAIETYYTDKGTYAATVAQLRQIEPTLPLQGTGAGQMTVSATPTTYTATVYSKPSLRAYTITRTTAGMSRTCTVPAGQSAGGCNASGSW